MFSGIVKGLFRVSQIKTSDQLLTLTVSASPEFCAGIQIGASIAVDGVCLTVVAFTQSDVTFDVINETLSKTTLNQLKVGQIVGCERALKMGDEIGGHLVSGHVWGVATIDRIDQRGHEYVMTLACPPAWMKYILPKGYVALDGASLTVVDVDPEGFFTVHLIPETLRMTSLGTKQKGDKVNLEIDSQTQAIVDSLSK